MTTTDEERRKIADGLLNKLHNYHWDGKVRDDEDIAEIVLALAAAERRGMEQAAEIILDWDEMIEGRAALVYAIRAAMDSEATDSPPPAKTGD